MRSAFSKATFACFLTCTLLALGAPLQAEDPGSNAPRHELIVLFAQLPEAPSKTAVLDAVAKKQPLPGALAQAAPLAGRAMLSSRHLPADRKAGTSELRQRLERYVVLSYGSRAEMLEAQRLLAADPWIEFVGENLQGRFYVEPSDPEYTMEPIPEDYQWGLHELDLAPAWDWVKGHAYIGVHDTGIARDHPDLRAFPTQLQVNNQCFYASGTFEGGNFRPHLSRDVYEDTCSVIEPPTDTTQGHGTHVAGIAAATTDNALGGAGYCWHCPLMLARNRNVDLDAFAEGLTFLTENGAQIINMSNGFPEGPDEPFLQPIRDAMALAAEHDILLVAASGNGEMDPIEFPANHPLAMAIGGTQPGLTFWVDCLGPGANCNSNRGPEQELVAPAREIISTFVPGGFWNNPFQCSDAFFPPANDGFGHCTGTSMSAPAVSGIAGLLRTINPLLDREQIRGLLNDHASMSGSGDPMYGNGIPNPEQSAKAALGMVAAATLENRLTPVFNLWSADAETHFQSTIPQQVVAQLFDGEVDFVSVGDPVGAYTSFPKTPNCKPAPCDDFDPLSWFSVFATYRTPAGMADLIPLYRLRKDQPIAGNPLNRSFRYALSDGEVTTLKMTSGNPYRLDGIEGYIHPVCAPEPSCIPAGATPLYRLYNSALDDQVLVPQSQLGSFPGYTTEKIGYAYENLDTDGDLAIDGFETFIGTNPQQTDSDGDGLSDGAEIVTFPYSDPLDGIGCTILLVDHFDQGNANGWASQQVNGTGSLGVDASAAAAGPFGFFASVYSARAGSGVAYLRDDSPDSEDVYRARFTFEIDPTSLANLDTYTVFALRQEGPNALVARIELEQTLTSQSLLAIARLDNGSTVSSGAIALASSGPQDVEVVWRAATIGSSNGSLELIVDGQSQLLSGLDNDGLRTDHARLGIVGGANIGTDVRLHFDSFESCSD